MLRLKNTYQAEAIRRLWPHLLNELFTVFENKDQPTEESNAQLVSTNKYEL
jgi:hypothetical protein